MARNINQVIKAVVIYAAQVAAVWGPLEAYSYFKGNALKEFIGSYWFLIYILPLFTTTYAILREAGEEVTAQETKAIQKVLVGKNGKAKDIFQHLDKGGVQDIQIEGEAEDITQSQE